jgi:hypothetical protein
MNSVVKLEHPRNAAVSGDGEGAAFKFLPATLAAQCQALIESFHEMHGYACLPDIMWKAGLGPFIKAHSELRDLLKKASTTRSAKKSNAGFVRIATNILSLEILANHFAGWNAIYPDAARQAEAILTRHPRGSHTRLLDFYLHPPRYPNSASIAVLVPRGSSSRTSDFAR